MDPLARLAEALRGQDESFALTVEACRARRGAKWHRYPDDVLAAWVADMDFAVAPCIRQAVLRLVEQTDFGYAWRQDDDSLAAAFAERMQARSGWTVDPANVVPVPNLVQALFASTLAFSQPGDGIAIQTPIYPPFLHAIDATSRRQVENPLRDDGTRFVLDAEHLRHAVDAGTRILMVCNPHNPAGRVFTRAELRALADLALERDLIIISDEIHSDLVYPGHQHIPMASLGADVAARTITLYSATKSFNIPGLKAAVMYFGSPELKERFHRTIHERLLGGVNAVGHDATVAAWREGGPWLEAVMRQLQANRDRLTELLRAELPRVHYYPPEATYLAWLNFRAYDPPLNRPYEFFLNQAKIGLNNGADFGKLGEGCVRLNFATSPEILNQIFERMAGAVRSATLHPVS